MFGIRNLWMVWWLLVLGDFRVLGEVLVRVILWVGYVVWVGV